MGFHCHGHHDLWHYVFTQQIGQALCKMGLMSDEFKHSTIQRHIMIVEMEKYICLKMKETAMRKLCRDFPCVLIEIRVPILCVCKLHCINHVSRICLYHLPHACWKM